MVFQHRGQLPSLGSERRRGSDPLPQLDLFENRPGSDHSSTTRQTLTKDPLPPPPPWPLVGSLAVSEDTSFLTTLLLLPLRLLGLLPPPVPGDHNHCWRRLLSEGGGGGRIFPAGSLPSFFFFLFTFSYTSGPIRFLSVDSVEMRGWFPGSGDAAAAESKRK